MLNNDYILGTKIKKVDRKTLSDESRKVLEESFDLGLTHDMKYLKGSKLNDEGDSFSYYLDLENVKEIVEAFKEVINIMEE